MRFRKKGNRREPVLPLVLEVLRWLRMFIELTLR